jgi:hypothetical protein
MAKSYAPGTAGVNPNPALRTGGLTLLDIVIHFGGGYIPDDGEFNQRVWAGLLGISPETFRDWLDRFRIPHRKPGNDVFVSATDLRSHLPRKYWDHE